MALDDGTGLFYALSICIALGIWLVFARYQTVRNRAVLFTWPAPDAADPDWSSITISNPSLEAHLQNPDLLPPVHVPNRRYITCYDPATSLYLGTFLADDAFVIGEKIGMAGRAQHSWKQSSFADRKRVMRSLLKWLVDNQEDCARVTCRDTGKTMVDAALGEILTTCAKLEWLIDHGESYLRPEKRGTSLMMCYKRAELHYEPLGVVAAIVSWNYPLHNAWSPILAAIFAGNGVVVKCSEQVVWSTSWFIGAIRECLTVCGFDPDLVQVVCCWPEEAEALTASPHIRHITFIGSEEVGRKVAMAATTHLTPVTLELGGKDPAIILPGMDLSKCISTLMRGVFQNAGQNCIGIERIIVHASQYDELLEMIVERATNLRLGSVLHATDGFISPVDCGSMISRDRFSELERIISDAVKDGASLHVGGLTFRHAYLEDGSYFSPTVIGDVHQGMEIADKELFAPVAVLMKYDSVEDAIETANATRYGLGASVWGPDQDECLRVAKRLECGMVSVNDFAVFYLNQNLPFGGVKSSGYGRFSGPEGLRSLTNPKAVVVDRWPFLIQTSIPAALDYPIRSLVSSWEFVGGLIQLLHGDTLRSRFTGLLQLIRAGRR
ncbi:meiotic sister-chromatid recombination aldehyde dehydrogenase [Fomitiporia mediterranea MF3/22]|uniref:meiotic sister-chromatid recombination aldehyde dehydrogenase n=1 Tax=Fomitiporia mediterranea (strain MF3/22) TaxID=694068 RepID=UPI0004408E1C|nr:meiotic sister-chromatid recombination aldehyde dehydrogenase [Fomitiporia mediterranea MF3/22]EJD03805.1 meiotic sister-chromatid recombination aldehyde dehydrogenase [Fomitiporia mediterranea MF3/22]